MHLTVLQEFRKQLCLLPTKKLVVTQLFLRPEHHLMHSIHEHFDLLLCIYNSFNLVFPVWLPGSGAVVDGQVESHCQRKLSTSLVSSESSMLVPAPGFCKPLALLQYLHLVFAFTSTSHISHLILNLLV